MERIPKKVIQINFLWLFICTICLILFGGYIVTLLFGERFKPITPLILPLALAAFFQGMYQPYTFLAAKEKGKWIRNIAFVEANFNIVGNFVLIYMYGVMGAAIASGVAKFITYALCINYYKRFEATL